MIDSSDRDLILRARCGETAAFGELVQRTQSAVFNVCYRLMGERRDAEDMSQEVFIRAYARLDMFDIERPFLPWIRRVAANVCLNRLSAQPPELPQLDEERDKAPAAEQPAWQLEQRQESERVRTALLSLTPRYRLVIELRHYQELSYEEIAQTLDLPLSAVKSDLFRARKLLAEKLKDEPSL
jgi:RNA polymerase sigma-70 factor (ECF subfamily)